MITASQRRGMETRYVEEGISREDAYARELYEMQAADAENYQKLKVKLETDVAILEQQLEHMKVRSRTGTVVAFVRMPSRHRPTQFTYLLNTEKLEYNYRVLTERDNENKATLTAQKQRLMRLRAALTKAQAEYESSDKRYKDRNTLLTQDFQRITRQYRDLQAKYKHFEVADAHRHSEVTRLHQEELGAMVDRLVAADRVITEQLLGWTWVPPAPSGAAGGHSPSAPSDALQLASGSGEDAFPAIGNAAAGGESEVEPFVPSSVDEAYAAARVMADDGDGAPLSPTDALGGDAAGVAEAIPRGKLRGMLSLIVRECGRFLLDAAVVAACERLEAPEEGKADLAAVVRADAVLHAIGCSTLASAASLLRVGDSVTIYGAMVFTRDHPSLLSPPPRFSRMPSAELWRQRWGARHVQMSCRYESTLPPVSVALVCPFPSIAGDSRPEVCARLGGAATAAPRGCVCLACSQGMGRDYSHDVRRQTLCDA